MDRINRISLDRQDSEKPDGHQQRPTATSSDGVGNERNAQVL
jgi:hypothetical protein